MHRLLFLVSFSLVFLAGQAMAGTAGTASRSGIMDTVISYGQFCNGIRGEHYAVDEIMETRWGKYRCAAAYELTPTRVTAYVAWVEEKPPVVVVEQKECPVANPPVAETVSTPVPAQEKPDVDSAPVLDTVQIKPPIMPSPMVIVPPKTSSALQGNVTTDIMPARAAPEAVKPPSALPSTPAEITAAPSLVVVDPKPTKLPVEPLSE